jgi:hypothetical protein
MFMPRKRKADAPGLPAPKEPPKLYTLEVKIIAGPVSEAFVKANPVVSRTIQIRGDQSLDDLHEAIYDAFDRDDPHMYEFQFGKRPMDRNGDRYVMEEDTNDPWDVDGFAATTATRIDQLGLKPRKSFFYWFDFGDDWWHKVSVKKIEDEVPKGKYPKVVAQVGESPPQYSELDEEDE